MLRYVFLSTLNLNHRRSSIYHVFQFIPMLNAYIKNHIRLHELSMTLGEYIVIQSRTLPFGMSLNRTWDEYKKGFGDLNGEFWLGLEKLYRITMEHSICIQIRSKAGKLFYNEWNYVYIGGENEQYVIKSMRGNGDSNVNGYYFRGNN